MDEKRRNASVSEPCRAEHEAPCSRGGSKADGAAPNIADRNEEAIAANLQDKATRLTRNLAPSPQSATMVKGSIENPSAGLLTFNTRKPMRLPLRFRIAWSMRFPATPERLRFDALAQLLKRGVIINKWPKLIACFSLR